MNNGLVATNGVFDILHPGHVRLLKIAKSYGRYLIVGINSDRAVKLLKGETRPIFSQNDRAEILRELRCVDEVVVFDDVRATEFLAKTKPSVWVKGGDYTIDTLCKEEKAVVESNGGTIAIVPIQSSWSTSAIIDKIQ